jgi:hypothetical protein
MTDGLDVLVHDVIAAIATAPWSSSNSAPSSVTVTGLLGRPSAPSAAEWNTCGLPLPFSPSCTAIGSLAGKVSSIASSTDDVASTSPCVTYALSDWRNAALPLTSSIRSCGRFGPAMDGTIVARSSSSVSE